MQLTKEQIKRIDNFLEGIGIEYIDIRFEMIDHIASEIEAKIEDKNVFFESNGFQTPFVKYMLSRKKDLFDRYNKQAKKLNWYYTKNIITDVFKRLILPKNSLFLGLIAFLCIWFGNSNLRYTLIFIFILLIFNSSYTAYLTYSFNRKFKDVRIVRTYISFSTMLLLIPLNFPNFIIVFYEGNYHKQTIYIYLIAFIFSYLLNQSYLRKKEFIENKYQYLQ